jgi:hypothetical protein
LIGNSFGNRVEIRETSEIHETVESKEGAIRDVTDAKLYLKSIIMSADGESGRKELNDDADISLNAETKEAGESYSDKVEKQEKEIINVETGEKVFDRTNTIETGNYGEMKTDQDLRNKGYDRISNEIITDIDGKTHQGLDGVYYNPEGNPQYIIVDSKYGSAQLSETKDGKQMSDSWVDARLDKDLGSQKADEIRMEKILNSDNVGCYVAHVDAEGNVTYDKLDGNANVVEKDVKINE